MSPMKAILSFAVIAAVVFCASAEQQQDNSGAVPAVIAAAEAPSSGAFNVNKVSKRFVSYPYPYGSALVAPAATVYHAPAVSAVTAYHTPVAAPVASVYHTAAVPAYPAYRPYVAAPSVYHTRVAAAYAPALTYHAPALSSGVSTIYH